MPTVTAHHTCTFKPQIHKELAEQKGLTQSKLMRMADLNMKTVQGLYREPYRLNVAYLTLEKVAKALNMRIDELFEEVEDEKKGDIQA